MPEVGYGIVALRDLAYCVANAAYAAGQDDLHELLQAKLSEYVPENQDEVLERLLDSSLSENLLKYD